MQTKAPLEHLLSGKETLDTMGKLSKEELAKRTKIAASQAIQELQEICFENSRAKGFWPEDRKKRNVPEMLALIHSEISEALEAHRKNKKQDDHCPDYTGLEIELADAIIRILDLSGGLDLRLGRAIIAKLEYNITRPHLHGKAY